MTVEFPWRINATRRGRRSRSFEIEEVSGGVSIVNVVGGTGGAILGATTHISNHIGQSIVDPSTSWSWSTFVGSVGGGAVAGFSLPTRVVATGAVELAALAGFTTGIGASLADLY